MGHPISVIILSQNSERTIKRCLNSVTWADEVLVVDGGSSDLTQAICQTPDAPWAKKIRWISNPFKSFRAQRNFSLENAKFDWVLVLDSDEACSVELAHRIQTLLSSTPPFRAYKVRRKEYFLGRQIHFGMWNPSYQDRFFHREGVEYINDVHEYPRFSSAPGILEEPIEHDPDFNVEMYLHKLNRYTTLEALDRYQKGKRTNLFHLVFAFPAMTLKTYFYYKSYRDGYFGVITALLEGMSRLARHIKLWQIQRLSFLNQAPPERLPQPEQRSQPSKP